MQRKWIILGAALVAALPAILTAQRTPRAPRPPREPRAYAYSWSDNNHGRIGVLVNTEPDSATDKVGARLDGVTPGGPAAKAGLKVGDIITRFNGTSLAGAKAEDDEESGPGAKLVELARKLEPGDTVQVEYRRGGGSDTKKTTVVAEDLGPRFSVEMPKMTAPPGMVMPRMPDMKFEFFGSPWGELELVSLNPDLGEYFGTKDGLLVVRAPADSSLPLKAGDVILSIGGRKPTSTSHAVRILRSYDPGETVAIDIMRKQKRTTVSWKVPEPEERRLRRQLERRSREEQSRLEIQLRELEQRAQAEQRMVRQTSRLRVL